MSFIQPFVDTVGMGVKGTYAVVRDLAVAPAYLVGCAFYEHDGLDPSRITKFKTPILLVHGSGANQRQWDLVRKFFESDDTGHVFSLNLNGSAFKNDEKDIRGYVDGPLAEKIGKIRALYAEAGYGCDEIHVIGHSMGGLVAGDFATMEAAAMKVNTLVAISSPWHGSPLADKLFAAEKKPEGAFRTDSAETAELRERVMNAHRAGLFSLRTVSGELDPLVSVESSRLDLDDEHQMFCPLHDHHSTMMDPRMAMRIRERWLEPNTNTLAKLD